MSKPKSSLPDNVKLQCIAIVRDYPRLVRVYHDERRSVIEASPSRYTTVKEKRIVVKDGKREEQMEDVRFYHPFSQGGGKGIEDKAQRLEDIETWYLTRQMRAVDEAKYLTGRDLPDNIRQKLVDAIILNCNNRNNYPYEYLDIPGVGKTKFYHYKKLFLTTISKYLGLI